MIRGERLTIAEIARRAGISGWAVRLRLRAGVRGEALLAARAPNQGWGKRAKPLYDVGNGRSLTASEIAKIVGVTRSTITHRIARGVRGAKLLEKPARFVVQLTESVSADLDQYARELGVSRPEAVAQALVAARRLHKRGGPAG